MSKTAFNSGPWSTQLSHCSSFTVTLEWEPR
jgi:hypothetical protein